MVRVPPDRLGISKVRYGVGRSYRWYFRRLFETSKNLATASMSLDPSSCCQGVISVGTSGMKV